MIKYTKSDISSMSYTDFISFIKEENRPSGGKKTIREILINSFINKDSNVLEIGCTNGFTSLEINKLIKCNVIGIDINMNSIDNANERIIKNKLDPNKIKFEHGNVENMKYKDETFDLIVCGNALSFVENQNEAISEIIRVLKPNGMIALVPIWYKQTPDFNIVDNVNKILGFQIKCTREDDWLDFSRYNLELYLKKDYKFDNPNKKDINAYVDKMISSKEHLKSYDEEVLQHIKKRWESIISIFNDNLKMTNYSIILLRKSTEKEEEEIFMTKEI